MCIFCKIVNNEIPSSKVYEDDEVLAILDLSQVTLGHTIVLSKKHYDNMLEIPNNEFANIMSKVQIIAKELVDKLGANGFNILVNTNEAAGQTVMHLHIHIIPRYDDNDGITIEFKENSSANLNDILNKIKS